MTKDRVLSKEIKTFNENKEVLLREKVGKFVLIKGSEIIDTYDSQNDAIKVGIDKFGNAPFLVKKIAEIEETQNFTSNLIRLAPCHQ